MSASYIQKIDAALYQVTKLSWKYIKSPLKTLSQPSQQNKKVYLSLNLKFESFLRNILPC